MTKFYDTEEFKALNKEWHTELLKQGFKDAEQPDGNLKVWTSTRFRVSRQSTSESIHSASVVNRAKETYYRMARQFLHEHKFTTSLERKIWEHHSEGVGLREIDKRVNKTIGNARRVVDKLIPIMRKSIRLQNGNNDDE